MRKEVFLFLSLVSGILLGSILFGLLKRQDEFDIIRRKLDKIKNIYLYIGEWVIYLFAIFFFLQFLTIYSQKKIFSISSLILLMIFIAIFTLFFLLLFIKNKNSLHELFVVVMIPLGLSFLFLMLPDFIPDEPTHFQKAYLTSNFNLTSSIYVWVESGYKEFGLKRYSDILSSIYFDFAPREYVELSGAGGYNFILYIFPAIGINLGKILHLSLYGCYYLGRMSNLIVYILFGYYSIKVTPKLKWMIFVFMFNPMLIHLGASYSSDCMINGLCIFSVAYMIKLYYTDEKITNKDILIVIALIFLVAVAKYAFLPIFGIYFLILPKVIKIQRKQWLFLILCIIGGFLFLVLHFMLSSNTETLPSQASYLIESNVNGGRQAEILLTNPISILAMLKNTFLKNIGFYLASFAGQLGWLNIDTSNFSLCLFFILLLISICFDKTDFSILNRIWFVILALLLASIIVLGLYLYWTPVGAPTAMGVQGRYFVPCVLLILMSVSNGVGRKICKKEIIVFLGVFIVNIIVFKDVIAFFM
ncbi:hypothetical protein B5F14_07755 [Faecalitalea cylindroides]|uniref:DUF2142 domain-containing protein n=1 Tax=Faecalitalea cylindroides TaxID=39483 RepID=A0A1Y4LQL7_9FIRM|nr:DUF2142 domain-containing protein [Faecalitalea cylindroides]OUP58973.1 hypothetical protein B5F14_07755 [Faecalitalea cylindroides]